MKDKANEERAYALMDLLHMSPLSENMVHSGAKAGNPCVLFRLSGLPLQRGKLKSAVLPDAALNTFKAAGPKFQKNVIAAEPASDITAESGDFPQKSSSQRLHGGDDAGFTLILFFPGHFCVVQIQIRNPAGGAAGREVASRHHIYGVGCGALFAVIFFAAFEGFHKLSSFLWGGISF